MKHIAFAGLLYSALVLQLEAGRWAVGPFVPQFLWVIVVAAVFLYDGATAIVWAAIVGGLSDCLTPDRLGLDLILATLTAAAMQRWCVNGAARTLLAFAVWIVPGLFVAVAASLILRSVIGGASLPLLQLVWISGGIALYSGALAIAAVIAFRFLIRGAFGSELSARWNAALCQESCRV